MSDFVNTLITSGLDAFTNLYDVEFSFPTNLTDSIADVLGEDTVEPSQLSNILKLRVGDFNAPQPRQSQYVTDYKTIQLTRQAPMMEFERKFDLNFRVDSNYVVYTVLKRWAFLYHDIMEGGINLPEGDETELLGKITVKSYDPNTGETIIKWVYDKVLCNKCTEPNFSRAGTEPVVATASFMFFDYLPESSDETQLEGTLAD